jgi:hypothetical protein
MEESMSRSSAAWGLVLAGFPDSRPAGTGGGGSGRPQAARDAGGDRADDLTGRQKGLRDAERDVQGGVLKLKEYPPLRYSLAEVRSIKLLEERCGVGHEVLAGPGAVPGLRAAAEGYNGVMTAEIKKRFGADILARLRRVAGGLPKGPDRVSSGRRSPRSRWAC